MAERMLVGASHLSEFVVKPNGVKLTGTCGETSLAVAMSILDEITCTPARIISVTEEMDRLGLLFNPRGDTNIANLGKYARVKGYSVRYEKDYSSDNWSSDEWKKLLRDNAGIYPIVLNLADGKDLIDVETGARDEAKLQYHVICVVGKKLAGYICCDGDNPQANSRYQIYTAQTLQNALPCGMLILDK